MLLQHHTSLSLFFFLSFLKHSFHTQWRRAKVSLTQVKVCWHVQLQSLKVSSLRPGKLIYFYFVGKLAGHIPVVDDSVRAAAKRAREGDDGAAASAKRARLVAEVRFC